METTKTIGITPQGAPFSVDAHWEGLNHVATGLVFEAHDGLGSFSFPAKLGRNGDLFHAVLTGQPHREFLAC